VEWRVAPEAEVLAARLPPLIIETLFHAAREAIRNAARHARGEESITGYAAPLRLSIAATAAQKNLEISIADNGVGPGSEYSSLQSGGSGQGLALHSTMMAVAGGALAFESVQPQGTRVRLTLGYE
jgi:signal transduction histidine kinase